MTWLGAFPVGNIATMNDEEIEQLAEQLLYAFFPEARELSSEADKTGRRLDPSVYEETVRLIPPRSTGDIDDDLIGIYDPDFDKESGQFLDEDNYDEDKGGASASSSSALEMSSQARHDPDHEDQDRER